MTSRCNQGQHLEASSTNAMPLTLLGMYAIGLKTEHLEGVIAVLSLDDHEARIVWASTG